jgi:8-oxo-dGTP diphosphatase
MAGAESISFDETAFRKECLSDGITHISTGVAVLRDKKVLLVRRASEDELGGIYEFPGGGVDDGETIIEGAARELYEETGLTADNVICRFRGFDYKTSRKPHVRQVNMCVTVLPAVVKLNPSEHDNYVWVDRNEGRQYLSGDPHMLASFEDLFKELSGDK